jgi:hypothetical protein
MPKPAQSSTPFHIQRDTGDGLRVRRFATELQREPGLKSSIEIEDLPVSNTRPRWPVCADAASTQRLLRYIQILDCERHQEHAFSARRKSSGRDAICSRFYENEPSVADLEARCSHAAGLKLFSDRWYVTHELAIPRQRSLDVFDENVDMVDVSNHVRSCRPRLLLGSSISIVQFPRIVGVLNGNGSISQRGATCGGVAQSIRVGT